LPGDDLLVPFLACEINASFTAKFHPNVPARGGASDVASFCESFDAGKITCRIA
jgi:hypothetical protein